MKYNIAFAGTPAFTLPVIEMLQVHADINLTCVITQPDKPVGRKRVITPSPVAQFGDEQNIPVFKAEKASELKEALSSIELDLIVVIAYGVLFPEWLLSKPTKGCINIHYSLLPEFRGATPIQSALLAGKTTSGLSIFKLVKAMDAGDIIYQEQFSINGHDTYEDVLKTCETLTTPALEKVLIPYLNDGIIPTPQNESDASFCYTFTKEDGKIDWKHDSAEHIYNKYRAFHTWPGIHTTWQGETVKLHEIRPTKTSKATPGRMIIENNAIFVGTKTHDIEIRKIQKAGKKQMTTVEFLQGYLTAISKTPFLL